MKDLTQIQVVGFLRDMAYDHNIRSPEYAALTVAADALESVTTIQVDRTNGQAHVHIEKIHPMLDAEVIEIVDAGTSAS